MKKETYYELGKSSQGRKQAHDIMLDEVRARVEKFKSMPSKDKSKSDALFNKAFEKISTYGNTILFDYFANEELTDRDFLGHVQSALRDGFVEI